MACFLFVTLSVVGCKGNSKNNTGSSNDHTDVTLTAEVSEDAVGETELSVEATSMPVEREELSICDSHPLCFKIGNTEVTMDERLGVAILDVQWINDEQIGVTINVDKSVNYFIMYSIKTGTYEHVATGTDFVWKDEDISTLSYIESTSSGEGEMSHYWIKDYNGNIIYESKEEVSELSYNEDGELHFMVWTADGLTEEIIACDKADS